MRRATSSSARDEPSPPLLDAGAPVGARVEHDEGQPEPLGALEVVDEGAHGARPLVRVGRGQVDEVVRVGARGAEPRGGELPPELERLVLVEAPAGPAQLVLEEELDDAAPGRHAAPDRVRQPAGDRHVRAEVVGRGADPDAGAPGAQPSFFTSARIFAGSGSSPRP